MEKKSNKGVVISLLVVIAVLIGSITYMFVSGTVIFNTKKNNDNKTEEKENNKNENDKENEKQEEEQGEAEPLDLNSVLVQDLYSYVNLDPGYGDVKDFFGSYGNITNKEVSDEIKLLTTLVVNKLGDSAVFLENRQEYWGTAKVYSLSGSLVLNELNKIYGKDNGYTHLSEGVYFPMSGMSKNICATIKYNATSENYEIIEQGGCGGAVAHSMHGKLIGAEKVNDKIVLTEKIYMSTAENIYKTIDATEIIGSGNNANSQEYFDKGATTEYTFKLAEDGSYYFDSKTTY